MINYSKLEGMFRRLDEYLTHLQVLAQVAPEQLTADAIRLGAAKYYLQIAIECCVDIANYIIARQNWRAPRSLADSFAVLVENGILPTAFEPTARRMAGLRNRLVHLYWEVDADTLCDTLRNNLTDFERFKAAIHRYLQTLSATED